MTKRIFSVTLILLSISALFAQAQGISQSGISEAVRITSPSKPAPGEISKGPDQKRLKTIPEQIVKSQEAISPIAKLPKKESEPKEKIGKEPLEIENPIFKEMPKPISEERPKVEELKTIPQEPPIAQPSRPIEPKPTDQKSQVAQKTPAKPAAPKASMPPMPHPFVKEPEVKEFLAKYVDRYRQRDIEGFLLLFSPMAIQNQKDGIEEIRKIYSRQFELYERLNYQLKNPKIEILEKSVKVRASYEIEQFSKKGETKQLRGEVDWTLFKEGGELKILTIQYLPDKTK